MRGQGFRLEGTPSLQRHENRLADALDVSTDVIILHAHDAITLLVEKPLAQGVTRAFFVSRMCGSVDFNDELVLAAKSAK